MSGKADKRKCKQDNNVDPRECSKDQIKNCHGEVKKHSFKNDKKNEWTTHKARYERLLKSLSTVADTNGFMLNSDNERIQKVVGLMTENLVAEGKPFCPCKQSHPLNTVKDVVCPCPEWKTEIEKDGHCFCRLFFRKTK